MHVGRNWNTSINKELSQMAYPAGIPAIMLIEGILNTEVKHGKQR